MCCPEQLTLEEDDLQGWGMGRWDTRITRGHRRLGCSISMPLPLNARVQLPTLE